MKKIILTSTACLFTLLGYSQIPTINEKFIDYSKFKIDSTEKKMIDSLKKLNGEIDTDSIEKVSFTESYDKKIDSISNIIKVLLIYQNQSVSNVEKMIKISEEIEMKKNLLKKVKKEKDYVISSFSSKKQRFLPTSNKYYRNYFFDSHYSSEYNKTALLTSFSATINNDAKTIQSELVADRIKWFRVSLGSVMSIASDTTETKTEENNIERLISGGGNFYLDFTLPIFTSYTDSFITNYSYLNFKAASDISGFGNNVDVTTFNGSIGFTNYLGFSSDEKKFNFFILGDVTAFKGNRGFHENLNLDSQDWFLNSNISVGVTFLNNYRVVCRTNFSSEPSLRTEKFAVGIQLLPNN
jgi:hypothetical protein